MKNHLPYACLLLLAGLSACRTPGSSSGQDDGKIEVVFVQVNDVYEIEPLAGGKEGGMARVATLKKQYLQKNPNTFLVMAGDFLSPSVYNSLQYEGESIRGKQMVEAMNTAGMDMVVFGNHEFDIKENELQERLNESKFQWIASNTFHKHPGSITPFSRTSASNGGNPPFPKYLIRKVSDKDGTTAKIGFIGLTLPFNKADYVSYTDPRTTAKELFDLLKDSVDAVVAITHQSVEEDILLAKELPGLSLILGGHEHDMRLEKEGDVYITKAHANAKSAYVVELEINKKTDKTAVVPKLTYLDEKFPLDSSTNLVVQKWTDIAEKNFSTLGFEARKVVLADAAPLDGRESEIRSHPTNLTRLIVAAMADASPQAEVILFNAGSVRVDDILQMPVTQFDIIRSLPFGGGTKEADIKGSLLLKVLEQGKANTGNGGFLHFNEALTYEAGNKQWQLQNKALDPAKTYRVAMNDFLLTGNEANLDFLNPNNPDIVKIYPAASPPDKYKGDIRLALIRYLARSK